MKIKLLLITCLALIACDNSNKEGSVYLRMQHEIDGDSLLTDTMLYVSPAISASRLYSVSVLQYYISRVNLIRQNGKQVEIADYHYTDVKDAATHETEFDGVPVGDYTGIRFTFGLNETDNVEDNLPPVQENLNMFLPTLPIFGGGYHYMKMEGLYQSPQTGPTGYATHFVKHTTVDRFFEVTLAFNGTLEVVEDHHTKNTVVLTMDINDWYRPGAHDFEVVGPAIMAMAPIQDNLSSNGDTQLFSVGLLHEHEDGDDDHHED